VTRGTARPPQANMYAGRKQKHHPVCSFDNRNCELSHQPVCSIGVPRRLQFAILSVFALYVKGFRGFAHPTYARGDRVNRRSVW
jgi:hypothetical protein